MRRLLTILLLCVPAFAQLSSDAATKLQSALVVPKLESQAPYVHVASISSASSIAFAQQVTQILTAAGWHVDNKQISTVTKDGRLAGKVTVAVGGGGFSDVYGDILRKAFKQAGMLTEWHEHSDRKFSPAVLEVIVW